ncbi:hypothetical protein SPHINGO391_460144 [Sphingomonas aurantiaca]|uniref:Uncharacterized protein n=1 Tax=Sphingomonas aurantiaca TaxID=185949 RepID=A0A5E7ZKS7_9SPHN|nr:hypothetical protein SPHINGO391_460144 [Sphingomonas aurantiaca]
MGPGAGGSGPIRARPSLTFSRNEYVVPASSRLLMTAPVPAAEKDHSADAEDRPRHDRLAW